MGKAMKKKSVSKVATGRFRKVLVLRGSKGKTTGGLTAADLIKYKNGRVVSKKASARAKKSPWIAAVKKHAQPSRSKASARSRRARPSTSRQRSSSITELVKVRTR